MHHNVSAIMGPHGGAWNNLIWAARDTFLLEFMPKSERAGGWGGGRAALCCVQRGGQAYRRAALCSWERPACARACSGLVW